MTERSWQPQALARSSTITVGVLDFIQLMAWNVPTTRHPSAAWLLRSLSSWPALNGPLSTLYSIFWSFHWNRAGRSSDVLSVLQEPQAEPAGQDGQPVGGQPVGQDRRDRGPGRHADAGQARDQGSFDGSEASGGRGSGGNDSGTQVDRADLGDTGVAAERLHRGHQAADVRQRGKGGTARQQGQLDRAGRYRPQARQQPGLSESPAPAGGQHDAGECGYQGEDKQQLASRRQLEGVPQLMAGQGEEDNQQDQVSDGSHQGVDADRGDAGSWGDPAFLQEPGVQGHAADVGGRDPVDERRGGLGQGSGPEGHRAGHGADQRGRAGQVGHGRGGEDDRQPDPVRGSQGVPAAAHVGELGQDEVEGAGQGGDGQQGARPDPLQAGQRLGVQPAGRGRGGPGVREQAVLAGD